MKRFGLLGSVAFLAVVASPAAYANSSTPSDDAAQPQASDIPTSDAIVVTARRRSEDVSKVPISISAFSEDTLTRKSILTTRDLTKITPGLNVVGSASLVNPFITIRGQSRGLAGPGSPGVIAYFNEVPLPTFGSILAGFDVDNIQVLKGPQGTLFGRNAIGGAVLNYSRRPTHDFGGYAEAEYGRFNSARIEGAINLPIVEDKIAIRLAAQMSSTDGYTKGMAYTPFTYDRATFSQTPGRFLGEIDLDKQHNLGLRASLLIEPSDSFRSTTVVDYYKADGVNNNILTGYFPGQTPVYALPPAVLSAIGLGSLLNPTYHCGTSPSCDIGLAIALAQTGNRRVEYIGMPPESVSTIFGVSNNTSIDLSENATIKNIFGYRTTKTPQNTDLDGVAMAIVDAVSMTNLEQVTDELQLSGSLFNNKLKYVLGGFYFKSSPRDPGGFQTNTLTIFNGLVSSIAGNFLGEESKAVYGQVDYDLSDMVDGLGFTAGYRYTWDKQAGCSYTADYSVGSGGTPVVPGSLGYLPKISQCKNNTFDVDPDAVVQNAANYSAKSSQGTYTLSANWQATPDVLFYATTRRGYRAGGYNAGALPASVADLRTFAPEVLTDVEIGTKGRYDIGGVRGNFAFDVFRGKSKRTQYYQSTTGIGSAGPNPLPSAGLLINKADVIIKGFEAELTVSPASGLTIGGNVSYTKINIDKISIAPSLLAYINDPVNLVSDPDKAAFSTIVIANQPKWQANANIEYIMPNVIGGANLVANADFHYQTEYAAGQVLIDGYETVDTRLTLAGLQNGAVDVSLFVRNLFNKEYSLGAGSSSAGVGVISYIFASPRTFGATVRYRFGE